MLLQEFQPTVARLTGLFCTLTRFVRAVIRLATKARKKTTSAALAPCLPFLLQLQVEQHLPAGLLQETINVVACSARGSAVSAPLETDPPAVIGSVFLKSSANAFSSNCIEEKDK